MASRQDKIAASQLARKLKLEKQFKPKLTRFFKQIGRDINVIWGATGNIPTLSSFEFELAVLLKQHYRAVAKAFYKEIQKEAKQAGLALEVKQGQEVIDNEIINFITSQSASQAAIILGTTTKELQQIMSSVLLNSALSDTPLSQLQIGKEIQKQFTDRTGARVDTIAITETNMTAERVKNIESDAFASQLAQTGQALINTWNTTLDERTRPAHVAADRQEVKQGRPYMVGGEMLKFPGDMSLGASIGNTINCRCSSVASIAGEPIALTPSAPLISTRLN